jgi:hypothetical protein
MLKVIELITRRLLIGEVSILEDEPALIIQNSYCVDYGMELIKYPFHSDENNTILNSANILTIYTPNDELTELYLKHPQYPDILADEQDEDATAILNTLYVDDVEVGVEDY